jgi:hypothetical protein
VVGFLVLVWIALLAILVLSPDVHMQTLRQVARDSRGIEAAFLISLSALIALLVVGVFRRWRWTFWLVLIAFFFGVLLAAGRHLEWRPESSAAIAEITLQGP